MKTWPHAPSKVVTGPGFYIITGSTYQKKPIFDTPEKKDILLETIFQVSEQEKWELMAWAVFANHYHVVAQCPETSTQSRWTSKVHTLSATAVNRLTEPHPKIWYRSWDTKLTFEKSLLARLAYVHNNPFKHGIVSDATTYPWCSANWFQTQGDPPFVKTVLSFKTDQLRITDDF